MATYASSKANILNPRKLYQVGSLEVNTALVKTCREVKILVTIEPRNIKLITKKSIRIIAKDKGLTHIGLIVVGVKGLTKNEVKGLTKNEVGAKALVMILDKRWPFDPRKSTVGSMEVDMNRNIG